MRHPRLPHRRLGPLLRGGGDPIPAALPAVLPALLLALLPPGAASAGAVYPGSSWDTATPEAMGMDPALLAQAAGFAGGAGMIVRSGYVVESWGNTHAVLDLKSTTKSLGSLLLGLAVGDGLLSLDDDAVTHLASLAVPPSSNDTTGWIDDVTIRSLATHSGGFPQPADYAHFLYEPGTAWQYSNCGADWLGDVLTVRFGQDLAVVLETRILDPIGVAGSEFSWAPHAYREPTIQGIPRRQIGSAVSMSVDGLARVGYLCLRQGVWEGVPLVPSSWIAQMGQADPSIASLPNLNPPRYPGATAHYGLLWWTNADGTLDAPTDTYFAWGLYESLIVVIPSLDVVAARLGEGWQDPFHGDYDVIAPFLEPIAASVLLPSSASSGMAGKSWGRVKAGFRSGTR